MARCSLVSLKDCGRLREVCVGCDLASAREKDQASGLRKVVERDPALARSCDRLWPPQRRRRHAYGRCRTSVKQILVSPLCVLILICEFHSIYLVVLVCDCRYLVEVVGELLQSHISKFGFELELVSLLLVHILVQF